jgi:hypothetical protein
MCADDPTEPSTEYIYPCCVFGTTKFRPSIEFPESEEEVKKVEEERKRASEECFPRFVQMEDRGVFTAREEYYARNAQELLQNEPQGPRSTDEAVYASMLNDFRHKIRAQVWLWCVPGMLFFVAWLSLLQYLQRALAEAANRKNINVSQYSVMISNVGGVAVQDDRLKDFGRYYGDVVAAFHIRNYGRYLAKNLNVCCFLFAFSDPDLLLLLLQWGLHG